MFDVHSRSARTDVKPGTGEKKASKIRQRTPVLELDKYVDVAIRSCFAACSRTEDSCTHDASLGQRRGGLPADLGGGETH